MSRVGDRSLMLLQPSTFVTRIYYDYQWPWHTMMHE